MDSIQALHKYGQSIWLDYICRSLVTSGDLKTASGAGVTGLTSNPAFPEIHV